MDRGDEQLEKGELEAALNLYRGAHELMRVPTTGIEVARTLARLGRLVEARDAALEVLRMPATEDESQPFRLARGSAEQLARELGEQIPLLEIEIVPAQAVAGAKLEIDGRRISPALIGLPLSLDPSSHRICLDSKGYRPIEQVVQLERSERKTLRIELQSVPQPVTSEKLATRGAPPRQASKPLAMLPPEPRPSAVRYRWPFWVGIGAGGVGLAVGSVAGIFSLQRTKQAKEHCHANECTAEAKSDLDAALLSANISNLGFVVGALGATVSLASWWLSGSPTATSPSSGSLRVMGTPGGGLLQLEGKL